MLNGNYCRIVVRFENDVSETSQVNIMYGLLDDELTRTLFRDYVGEILLLRVIF